MIGVPEGGRLADLQVLEAGRPDLRTNPGCGSDPVAYARTVKTASGAAADVTGDLPLQRVRGLVAVRNLLFIICSGLTTDR
jgi:hypothetical protein